MKENITGGRIQILNLLEPKYEGKFGTVIDDNLEWTRDDEFRCILVKLDGDKETRYMTRKFAHVIKKNRGLFFNILMIFFATAILCLPLAWIVYILYR